MLTRTLLLTVLLSALPALAKAPRLTLFISVDALGSDVLLRNQPRLKGGLGQLLSSGAFFPTAQYEYAECVTAPGHATLVTGANPSVHGIVSNRFWNRNTEAMERMFADPAFPLLEAPLRSTDDASPKNLMAETLADRLRLATHGKGKALSVTAKGRSAIAMAGQLGQAYWFHEGAGKFISSTYYVKAYPSWVKSFNERRLPESFFGKKWELLLDAKEYPGEDNRPFEADFLGLGRAFPHPLNAQLPSVGAPYYDAIAATPMMNDILSEFAVAALNGESLGKDDTPDVLFVGFSSTDHIYHHHGPYSWEMQDAVLRLDRALETLLAAATKAAGGRGNLLVILSADHGGSAIPEEWITAGLNAARVRETPLLEAVNKDLAGLFGVGKLVQSIEEVDVYLNARLVSEKKLDPSSVRRATAAALARQSGIEWAVSRDELFFQSEKSTLQRAFINGFFPSRSGDVLMMTRVHHVLSDEPDGASHGSPYAYDSQVPLILSGAGVVPGRYPQAVKVTSIAPTVATLWEMAPPAQSAGSPLVEALNRP